MISHEDLIAKGFELIDGQYRRPAAVPAGDSGPVSDVEQHAESEPAGSDAHEERGQAPLRCRIRFTVYRSTLCDPGSNCTKYFLDRLTHHGIITDDSGDYITEPEHRQRKCRKGDERTVIEVFQVTHPTQ